MEAAPRTTNRTPGSGLAALLLAIVVLSMLSYMVVRDRFWNKPATRVAELPVDEPQPEEPKKLAPLEAWPPTTVSLKPPAYEPPYSMPALPPEPEVFEADPLEGMADGEQGVGRAPLASLPQEESFAPLPPLPEEYEEELIFEAPPSGSGLPTEGTETYAAVGEFDAESESQDWNPPPYASSPPIVDAPIEIPGLATEERPDGTEEGPKKVSDRDTEALLAGEASLEELLIDTPAADELAVLLKTDVQEAFNLGRHGALFAARGRFVGVMRRVAMALDAEGATDQHSLDLAAGLGAIEEAAQFVPRGAALETDLDVRSIAASHRTPLYHGAASNKGANWTPPNEAIARYLRYTQHKLAAAVDGNPAGSMALHGLGKTYARLQELGEAPLAGRTSLTLYRAAIEAHPGNYLAANELGVGLAKVGRSEAARQALERAVAGGGNSTVYRNLAFVQQKLGRPQLAMAAAQRAEQLAVRERASGAFSREQGVEWVRPQVFTRFADAHGRRRGAGSPQPGPASTPAMAQRPSPRRVAPRPLVAPQNPTVRPVRSQTIVR